MHRLDDYYILMEEPQGKGLETVVMEFFEKHPDYTLLGGPYVHNGLVCQAVVRYAHLEQCDGKDLKIWLA